ncbi:MAG: rod shape-determining protein MreC [Candidatus Firestonebacteria bacterium]|nr:rod shape-determining protein MreC [Candidatus Firestonebacteria bacterium]
MSDFFWKWRREILFSLLIAIALGLLISQRKPDFFSQSIRQGITLVMAPLQKISTGSFARVRSLAHTLSTLGSLKSENLSLRQQLEALKLANLRLLEQAQENGQLREQLGYKQRQKWKFVPAEVIGRDPASWLETVVVNRGSADGIRLGAGVVTPEGVAGRVSDVQLYAATVMLLSDVQSSVATAVERSRVPGTVKGMGTRTLSMVHVAGGDDVRAADTVVTSSVSSIFPPGLPVGEVTQVASSENGLMLSVRVKPRVNFQTLDHLLILQAEE